MLAKVLSCAVVGLQGALVEVETDISPGLPSFTIVGLPDTAVQEAKERVRAAIRNTGYSFPAKRITVNLAPADLKKAGPAYDLPIAMGILLSSQQVYADASNALFLGELSLDGSIRHSHGILNMVALARDNGLSAVFVPREDAEEASLVKSLAVYPVQSLAQLTKHLQGETSILAYERSIDPLPTPDYSATDLCHIKGQEYARRTLEIAAAGGHNLLMCGPPGSGKTMLARAMSSILPSLTFDEALEVTKIYSVCGLLKQGTPMFFQRPFRSPHYTISHAGLVGGGHIPHPGEISLSHRGVLFLDELPEFNHLALESLRQPLEDKTVTISRAQGSVTFPANFMLLAAMNPCPCGYYGDSQKECKCTPGEVTRYGKRISGPLLDRIDIFTELRRVDYDKLAGDGASESSDKVAARVVAARQLQQERFKATRFTCNAEMTPAEVKEFCKLQPEGQSLLRTAMKQLYLTARAFHKLLKLSRTIADLDGAASIGTAHLAEAIQYRPRNI